MKKIVALLLVLAFGFSGCEKDDICDANTPTTPRLVMDFFYSDEPSKPKNVNRLEVIGEDEELGIVFNENATIEEEKYLTSANTISIPLDPTRDTVTYRFISNSKNPNGSVANEDILKFTYTRQNVYVSRACGFKTTYTLNKIERAGATPEAPADYWMKNVQILTPNIELENETHVEVFF